MHCLFILRPFRWVIFGGWLEVLVCYWRAADIRDEWYLFGFIWMSGIYLVTRYT